MGWWWGWASQLLELLELPQLIETCVSNGYYDEASELLLRAAQFHKTYKHLRILEQLVRRHPVLGVNERRTPSSEASD